MNDENQTMIRFIDSSYRTLFFIPDGGTIIVTRSDSGKVKRACTFLDEYHTRVGRETYHICRFAKLMERVGNTYAPEQLPDLTTPELPPPEGTDTPEQYVADFFTHLDGLYTAGLIPAPHPPDQRCGSSEIQRFS